VRYLFPKSNLVNTRDAAHRKLSPPGERLRCAAALRGASQCFGPAALVELSEWLASRQSADIGKKENHE
jgi:hypothetical protein